MENLQRVSQICEHLNTQKGRKEMKTEVKEIPFSDGSLLGIRTPDGKIWLAVRTACTDIGLTEKQAQNEVKKVKESLLFAQ